MTNVKVFADRQKNLWIRGHKNSFDSQKYVLQEQNYIGLGKIGTFCIGLSDIKEYIRNTLVF
jgi:hypothetical protein